MPKGQREYTPEQKAEALRLYPSLGPAETARQLKIGRHAIQNWVRNAGIELEHPPSNLVKAREVAVMTHETRKAELATNLFNEATDLLARFKEQETKYVGVTAKEVQYNEITFESAERAAKAIHNLIQDAQLLMGEATSRNETATKDEFASYLMGARDAYDAQVQEQA